jgi:GLPGLI family protein
LIVLKKIRKMKKTLLLAGCLTAISVTGFAQLNQGKVVYERTRTFQAHFNINGEENIVPQTRKDNLELLFGGNQTLWRAVETVNEDNVMTSDNGGMQIQMIATGAEDVLFVDLSNGKTTEKRELMDKTFLIDDVIHPLKWKMTGDTKTILNHPCMKAVATQVRQSMRMTMDNGKMERQPVSDTSEVIAWFASDIPVSAGPAEYQGQLPGLILELTAGRQSFVAKSISPSVDIAVIKAPTGKKRYTAEEFRAESDKMMKEMQQNIQGGGQRTIRMN